jgi:hypothetical protein
LSLYLTKHLAMKLYGGVEIQPHVFLTSAVDGGELSVSRLGHFSIGEGTPGIYHKGGRVDSRAGLDFVKK